MLMPSKYKYRKIQRGVLRGVSKAGTRIVFGDAGLRAVSSGFVTSRQIEACRVAVNRELKREGKLWIKIFPAKPYTKRPAETRMGKGKGEVEYYMTPVQPGRILFEVGGVPVETAKRALKKAAYKLPVKCKVVEKREVE